MRVLLALAGIVVALSGCKEEKEWGVDSFVGGVELSKMCESQLPAQRQACQFYILGVVDSRNVSFAIEKKKDWLCGEPTRADVSNAVLGYLSAHPDQLTNAAGDLVEVGVDKAFGCDYKK
jgi:hypothetical protein